MKNVRLVSHKQKIDAVFDYLKTLPEDPQLRSHWARYACILVSGFLEQSIITLCIDYASKNSYDHRVVHYVSQNVRRFSNAKMKKILALLGEYDPDLSDKIDQETKGKLADAVNSIVDNRHRIAHGETVGVSPVKIKEWYESVVLVVDKLEQHLA